MADDASRIESRPLIVVMGVSGSGKSAIGPRIAARFGAPFLEGDTLHSRQSIEKMSSGIPLDDDDRWPWLDRIGGRLREARQARTGLVVTCSALRRSYRERLRKEAGGDVYFLFLRGSRQTLQKRLAARRGHYMPSSLLKSQFAALESPEGETGVVTVDVDGTVEEVVDDAFARLERLGAGLENVQAMRDR